MVRFDPPQLDLRPDLIREALAGRVADLPPSKALALLEEADIPAGDKLELLRGVLTDGEADQTLQVAAIGTLARLDPASARHVLSQVAGQLTDRADDSAAVAAALALGRVGEPEDLETLTQLLEGAGSELGRNRVTFAQALIVHRFGLTDRTVDLPVPDLLPPPTGGGLPFVSTRPRMLRAQESLAALHRDLPWIDRERYQIVELQCGERLMEIAVWTGLLEADERRALAGRPSVPAVVAFQSVEHEVMNPALLALTRPAGQDRATVLITRVSGEPMYGGEAVIDASGAFELDLRAVRRPGSAAVAAKVRLTDEGLEISGLTSPHAEEPPQAPQPGEGPRG